MICQVGTLNEDGNTLYTYGLRKAHKTIEGGGIAREVDALRSRHTKLVRRESKTRDGDVVRHDVTRNVSGTIGDLERLVCVHKRAGRLWAQEDVVSLGHKAQHEYHCHFPAVHIP